MAYLLVGFLVLIAVGTLLLWLPIASRPEGSVPFLTALFTATSAVCVTGLVVVDTHDHFTLFGQVVILALIQLGGLGFMASSTLLILALGRRVSVSQRVVTTGLTGSLGASSVADLLKRIVIMTVAFEAIGTVLLAVLFVIHDGSLELRTLWRAFFTSVSAFNSAGFDIEGGGRNLIHFSGNPFILTTVAVLTLGGSLSFAVLWDVQQKRRWRTLTLNSKVVLSTFGTLILLGAVVIFFREISDPQVLGPLALPQAIVASLAESTYARTSGFTAFNLGAAEPEVLLLMSGLMFIGGASGSTAGGIKVNTFTTLFATIIASIRGRDHVQMFEREVPWDQVNRALTVALLSVAICFAVVFTLMATNDVDSIALIFETASAFGTAGLSTGITGTLNAAGQLTLIVAMFVGRVGPLTIALALSQRFTARERIRYPEAEINIG